MSNLAETNTSTLGEHHTSDATKTPKIQTVDVYVPVSWEYVFDKLLTKVDILPGLKSESTEAASCFLLKA
jgi:hypothetical protein